jgi:RNA polymerase sigma-70 factor (ECF subfamily)
MSDKQLAALAGQGDAEAYRRLFERYQNPVYNFVYRLVNNAEDASDVVQNAFLKMYTVLGERKDIENFSAYLYRTARNLAYDEMRRRSRFADMDEELLAPEDPNIYADPQRALMLQEQMGKVRKAAGRLNENQRAALILRELQDFDYDRMSEVMGSNRNAVGALLSRARLRFREELRMAQVRTEEIPPDCEAVIARLSPYIDDELSVEERATVDAHLQECTFCTAALEEMREASRSFRMLIPVVPPPDMAQAFTGRLQDLAARGGAGGSQTMVMHQQPVAVPQEGAGGGSLFSRLFHGRMMLGLAAAVVLFAVGAFLLAGETGIDDFAFHDESGADGTVETSVVSPDEQEPAVPVETTHVETQPDEPPAGTVENPPNEPQTPASTPPADNNPGGGTELSIGRVTISPNPVWEDNQFTVTVVVNGSAASVTADFRGMSTVPLTYQYGADGLETWSATVTAGAYGTYAVYIDADAGNGTSVSKYAGSLEVITLY